MPLGKAATAPVAALGQAQYTSTLPAQYALRPSDVIGVNVFRETGLSVQNVAIGADGFVSLPLIGPVSAQGLTTRDLEELVAQRLRQAKIKNPAVNVNIGEYTSHRVTVEGAVQQPGVYSFQPGDRLSSAIALAKGNTRTANLSDIAVFRAFDGEMAIARFDYRQIRQGTMMDPIINPGDRVVVGTSGLSQAWQDVLKVLPAAGLFAAAFR